VKFLSLLFVTTLATAQGVPKEQCFPIEQLPESQRKSAEELFLKLTDSEALYTVIGAVKPMSGGYTTFKLPSDSLDANTIDEARRFLAVFHCGSDLFATVHHFARLFPGKDTKTLERYFDGVVFNRIGLRRTILAHKDFFIPLGLSENAHPMEVLMAIEYLEGPSRFRGLGYLYGYPDYAVDFFVSASRQQTFTGVFVPRDFVSNPTFARADRGVVYAIEKGATEREADKQFRAQLAPILEEYKRRRNEYIGEGKPGIIALLRNWFCQSGTCKAPVFKSE
jgi:hypothetical protein